MIPIYDDIITATPAVPTGTLKITDDTIQVINIYNMSPHRIYVSLSAGQPDVFVPPNYSVEGLSLARQTGASSLSVGGNRGYTKGIQITKISASPLLGSVQGILSIMGFRVDENWQGIRPLVTGSLIPTPGGNVATSIVNSGNPDGTPIITTSTVNTPNDGSVNLNNDGSGTITLLDNGAVVDYLQAVAGSNIAHGQVKLGFQTDTFWTWLFGVMKTLQADPTGAIGTVPLITSDGAGNITLNKALFNAQFNQRTAGTHGHGFAGGAGKAVTAGDIWSFPISFPSASNTTATSVTLTVITSVNCSATVPTASINVQGCLLQLTATAAGAFSWFGTYTTVGD